MGAPNLDPELTERPSTTLRPSSPPEPQLGTITTLHDEDSHTAEYGRTHRGLSNRQVQLMAIAGSIGTGPFVGIGASLSTLDPISCLLAYTICPTLFIWPCNMCVAEMGDTSTSERSIYESATMFVDLNFGFALG